MSTMMAMSTCSSSNYVDLTVERRCGDSRCARTAVLNCIKGCRQCCIATNGDGTFTDVTREAGVYTTAAEGLGARLQRLRRMTAGSTCSCGQRSRAELLVPQHRSRVVQRGSRAAGWSGRRDGREGQAGMGTDFGDYDGDGRPDLVVTNFMLEAHNIFRNLGGGSVRGRDSRNGLRRSHPSVCWLWRGVSRLRQRRPLGPRDRKRPRARQRRLFQPERQICAAEPSLPQRGSWASQRSEPHVGARLSPWREFIGASPPAISTMTAISIFW